MALDFGKLAVEASKDKSLPAREVNILEFIEAPWGLGKTVALYPVQRVIIKAFYGIALDDTVANIKVTDFRRQNQRMMTEAGYLKYLYSQGRSNIEEVIPGKVRREMVLAIGRRSGKCVDRDTLVLTGNGAFRIGEVGNIPYESHVPYVTEVAQEGCESRSRSAFYYNGGTREVVDMTTSLGYNLKGTPNHRIRIYNPDTLSMEWRYMEDLRKGDLVGIHCGTRLWASEDPKISSIADTYPLESGIPRSLTPMWSKFMGYLCVSGYLKAHRIAVNSYKRYVRKVQNLFAVTIGDHHTWSEGNYLVTAASNKGVIKVFKAMGFGNGVQKTIPRGFLQATKGTQAAFLCGMLEAAHRQGSDAGLWFEFRNQKMCREVQVLLANFGIVARVSRNRDTKIRHRVSITGASNLEVLRNEIFSVTTHLSGEIQPVTQDPDLPFPGISQHLLAILNEAKSSFRIQEMVSKKIQEGGEVSQSFVEAMVNLFESMGLHGETVDKVTNIVRSGYYFDPVSTLSTGVSEVFDLNVPDGESFVAGAITNHNTFISSCIAAYETYRLITKGCPQKYYGMPSRKRIQMIALATDKNQASNLYGDVAAHFRESLFFTPYLANNTQSYAAVQTPYDIEKDGSWKDNPAAGSSIRITFSPCKAKAVRGFANIVAVFDEMAHFGQDGQSSAEEIYTAAEPSLATFTQKDGNEAIGPLESKIISISSPLGRTGKFYDLFQAGFNGGRLGEEMLCIQAPTWEVNPTIPAEVFESAYERDSISFFTEYGAEFSDRTRGWTTEEDIRSCINPSLKKISRGIHRYVYYAGFDFGQVGDASAIAIGHIEFIGKSPKIVVDCVDQIKAGEGKYVGQDRLEFDEIANWVADYTRRFRIVDGVFDQHTGIPFEQALANRGVKGFRKETFKPQLTSDIFKNFKDLLWDQTLQFYNDGVEDDDLVDYLKELTTLQAVPRSKTITTVEAPRANGFHDDMSDALVRMVWLASKHLINPKVIIGTSQGFASLTGGRHISTHPGQSNPNLRQLPRARRRR